MATEVRQHDKDGILVMTHRQKVGFAIGIATVIIVAAITWGFYHQAAVWQKHAEVRFATGINNGEQSGFMAGFAAHAADLPAAVKVSEAGNEAADGIYILTGQFSSQPIYTHEDWSLFRNSEQWMINHGEAGHIVGAYGTTSGQPITGQWESLGDIKPAPLVGIVTHKDAQFYVSNSYDATFNGDYFRSGNHNDKPAYTSITNKWRWWSGSSWFVSVAKGTYEPGYSCDGDDPATGTWKPMGGTPGPAINVVAVNTGKDTGHAKE